jgi:restriction system protein
VVDIQPHVSSDLVKMGEAVIQFSVPDVLAGKVGFSKVYGNYNARGVVSSYAVDLSCQDIGEFRTIKASDSALLPGKIEQALSTWAGRYEKHLERESRVSRANDVDDRNAALAEQFESLRGILHATLSVNDAINWEALKIRKPFRANPATFYGEFAQRSFLHFETNGRASKFEERLLGTQPEFEAYSNAQPFLKRLLMKKRVRDEFDGVMKGWEKEASLCAKENADRKADFDSVKAQFDLAKEQYDRERQETNAAVDDLKRHYLDKDVDAITEHAELVLSSSRYPDFIPRSVDLEYRPEPRMLVVDFRLPSPADLPQIESYRYVRSKNEIVEKRISDAAARALYDDVVYQICLRTLHEVFEADVAEAIDQIVFNGVVTATSPATGLLETKVIASVSASKVEFSMFDLSKVEPKATFRRLKGVAATRLTELAAVPPIAKPPRINASSRAET